MISRRHIQTGIFAVLLFASTFAGHRAHAAILSEPTGTCPQYLTATAHKNTPTGETPKYTLDKVDMQCIQGMCNRCGPKADGTFDTSCTKADAAITKGGIKTDIPCNYSVDDIFVTVLNIVRLIFGITGGVALAVFIGGALYYFILSAGESGKIKQGKSLMVNSIIAIMITFGAGAIVTFVTKSIGADIGTGTNSVGQIVVDPDATPDCPVNGIQGQDCNDNEETNMVCYYGPDVAIGGRAPIQGVCVDICRYNSLPPDASLINDDKGTYQCTDKTTLTPVQQSTCKTGLCPGAANVQCCKL